MISRETGLTDRFDNALIVEGGAMRGVFGTGVLDGFLELGFDPFDLFIGVSAGASNLAAYLARMPGRNLKIYSDYSQRPEFINLPRFLRGGHLMDLDWLWEITIREVRLDLETIYETGRPLIVGLTDVRTGNAVYRKTDAKNLEDTLMASSALPVLYRDFPMVDGRPAADGGIADPIPVAQAISMGATRLMVIRSRPRQYVKKEKITQSILSWRLKRFPGLQSAVAQRVRRYNDVLALIRKPPHGISIVEICPPPDFRTARLSRDPRLLAEGYRQGRLLAEDARQRWYAAPAV